MVISGSLQLLSRNLVGVALRRDQVAVVAIKGLHVSWNLRGWERGSLLLVSDGVGVLYKSSVVRIAHGHIVAELGYRVANLLLLPMVALKKMGILVDIPVGR